MGKNYAFEKQGRIQPIHGELHERIQEKENGGSQEKA